MTKRVYQRDDATGGRLGPGSETLEPAQVEGVLQMGGPVIPPACHHCGATGIQWVVGMHGAWCRVCGADWHLTHYTVTVKQLQPTARGKYRLRTDLVASLPAVG